MKPLIFAKIGGRVLENLMESPKTISWPRASEAGLCLVHGGGAAINEMAERFDVDFQFVNGQRVTSPELISVVELVLRGKMNPALVRCLESSGLKALGLSGSDSAILDCGLENPEMGLVGKVRNVNPAPIQGLLERGIAPVMAPLGFYADAEGKIVNCNADVAAVALAKALKPEHLIFFSDTDGLLDDKKQNLAHVCADEVRALIDSGVIQGGMHVKMMSILGYLEANKDAKVWLLNGLKDLDVASVLGAKKIAHGTLITATK